MRRREREEMHAGIGPEIDCQSAITRVLSLSRWQIEEAICPDIIPGWLGLEKGSGWSDSPRRLMSETLPERGSQLTPYQPEQQLEPTQEEKTSVLCSLREDLKVWRASWSAGEQEVTAERNAERRERRKKNEAAIVAESSFVTIKMAL